ncbi:hypothetical protein [Rhizobacter sp. Root1221]|uniref:hypothetical protein n=1 Tax=Rhizobacter sp. Root1221 TaxID=1736433 RepID=UPI000B08010D|nr:hypothetical protein [Rhizobacter sp. Root1221]
MLYALNTLVPFAVDPSHGGLARAGANVRCGSPVCMVFARAWPESSWVPSRVSAWIG